jgi:hypothetical protein
LFAPGLISSSLSSQFPPLPLLSQLPNRKGEGASQWAAFTVCFSGGAASGKLKRRNWSGASFPLHTLNGNKRCTVGEGVGTFLIFSQVSSSFFGCNHLSH